MSPDEVELHARSAKRQFDALGIDAHIEPEELRDIAAERQALMALPATVGDIESLKAEITELKRLVLSMKPAPQTVNVSFDRVDAYSRSKYQVSNMIAGSRA